MMLNGLNHITLTVSCLNTSLTFYTELLGFKGEVKWDKGAYLSLGNLWLCLSLGKPDQKLDYTHIAFSIDKIDLNTFAQKLIKTNISQWQQNTSEGDSIYFLDPDGYKLEVHIGDLKDRLKRLKEHPYNKLKWL